LLNWLGPNQRLQSASEAAEAAIIRDKRL